MYWSNQEIDTRTYPARCPDCNATKWIDFDWETGLGYCHSCGGTPITSMLRTLKQGRDKLGFCGAPAFTIPNSRVASSQKKTKTERT